MLVLWCQMWYRGAMIRDIKAYDCECDKCHHVWFSATVPARCASCKSRSWNGGAVVVESPAVVQVSRSPVVVPEPASKPAARIVQAGCKCGGSGVVLVGGKRNCAACGRALTT